MFESSKDILYIVIAVSIFGISFFVCWGLYYAVVSVKQLFAIVREMRDRLKKIDELIEELKNKFALSKTSLIILAEGIKKVSEILNRDKKKKK